LHTASRMDPLNQGQLDAGGNTVIVLDAGRRPPEPLSLHRWWDELPGHARPGTPRFEKEIARLLRQAQQINNLEIQTPPRHWIEESFNIARDQVYPGLIPDPEKPGAFLIRQDYWLEGRDITRERLALAGRRLAYAVEQALKDIR
ncbi:MAG: S1/P1 nuclease, partial [Fluviibacter sp.]